MTHNIKIIFYLFFLLFFANIDAANEYRVEFVGIENPDLLKLVESSSQLAYLQEHPPKTHAALQRRAEGDLPNIESALQSLGYYSPHIDFSIDYEASPTLIKMIIDPGAVYRFGQITILPDSLQISAQSIGIEPGRWFNSGVALIDVDTWRRGSSTDELIRFKRSMPPVLWFPDQDLLNKYFAGRILKLDTSWNRRDVAYSAEGQILHFAGSTKPWEMSEDFGQPGLRAWREVYALWGRTPVPKRKYKIKMRAASVMRHILSLGQRLAGGPSRLREHVGG